MAVVALVAQIFILSVWLVLFALWLYIPQPFQKGIYWSADTLKPDRAGSQFERLKVEYETGTAAVNGEAVSQQDGRACLRLVRTWWFKQSDNE